MNITSVGGENILSEESMGTISSSSSYAGASKPWQSRAHPTVATSSIKTELIAFAGARQRKLSGYYRC